MYIIKNHEDDQIYINSENKWFAHKLARASPEIENKSTLYSKMSNEQKLIGIKQC